MKFIFRSIVALLVIGLCAWIVYRYTTRGGPGRNAKTINTFSNVCVAVEPGLGQIRLNSTVPNVKQIGGELKTSDGSIFKVSDISVKDKGADREFIFNLTYDFDKGLTQIKAIKASVKYSELPKKYHQFGKWTVWVKREDQRK